MMKIQILNDLHNEVNRLFIAGAKFAKNDLRIGKLLPALQKPGEKSPAMKRLADLTGKLLDSDEPEEALLDLGVLLNAMLNTQGDVTSAEIGSLTETKAAFFTELPRTTAPYSTLEPVIKALTTTGSGRLEPVKLAHENGELNDFRLYTLLSTSLADKYPELADYLQETVIPALGSFMIPFLLNDLDITAKHKAQAQRLSLLDILGYEKCLELANKAVNEGSAVVQVAAIKILGKNTQNEELLLKLANDRKAETREAAFIQLIRMDSKAGKEKMIAALASSKFKPAIKAANMCSDPEYTPRIFECVKKFYEEKIDREDEKDGDTRDFADFLDALGGDKDEDYIFDFLVRIFKDFESPSKNKYHIRNRRLDVADDLLISHNNKKAVLNAYERLAKECKAENFDNKSVHYYFQIAAGFYSPEKMYDTFAPYYSKGYLDPHSGRRSHYSWDMKELATNETTPDPRWVDEFIKKEDINKIGFWLNKIPGRERIIKYLKLIAHKREVGQKNNQYSYKWRNAILILAENLQPDELTTIAEDVCSVIKSDSRSYREVDYLFWYHDEAMLNLFISSKHLLEEIRDFYDKMKKPLSYNQEHLSKCIDDLYIKITQH